MYAIEHISKLSLCQFPRFRIYNFLRNRLSVIDRIRLFCDRSDVRLSLKKRNYLSAHEAECNRLLALLDINKIIDQPPSHKLCKAFTRNIASVSVDDLYKNCDLEKPEGIKDEVSEFLREMSYKSLQSSHIQRLRAQMRKAHEEGWFFVFDTFTLDDIYVHDFMSNKNALRDCFRNIKRDVMRAEGIKSVESISNFDGYYYFCTPENGTLNGRLHFHVIHMFRTLPEGCCDPNLYCNYPTRVIVDGLRGYWSYGFSKPIAIRYSRDAFGKQLGWRLPVDKKTLKTKPCKPVEAVIRYVCKYVNKFVDQKRNEKWKTNLPEKLAQEYKRTFRVRMSRNLGMVLPSMKKLTGNALIELLHLPIQMSDIKRIIKKSVMKEMLLRLKKERFTLKHILTSLPARPRLPELLRDLMNENREFNLLNFIAMLTPTLSPEVISNETKRYIQSSPVFNPCI